MFITITRKGIIEVNILGDKNPTGDRVQDLQVTRQALNLQTIRLSSIILKMPLH